MRENWETQARWEESSDHNLIWPWVKEKGKEGSRIHWSSEETSSRPLERQNCCQRGHDSPRTRPALKSLPHSLTGESSLWGMWHSLISMWQQCLITATGGLKEFYSLWSETWEVQPPGHSIHLLCFDIRHTLYRSHGPLFLREIANRQGSGCRMNYIVPVALAHLGVAIVSYLSFFYYLFQIRLPAPICHWLSHWQVMVLTWWYDPNLHCKGH